MFYVLLCHPAPVCFAVAKYSYCTITMNVYSAILCTASSSDVAAQLHRLDHSGGLDWLVLSQGDLARRKQRVLTFKGREVAIDLPRTERLSDGAVLRLDAEEALVVKVEAEEWLRVLPRDAQAALRLGFHAGNLHWLVRFENDELLIAIEGSRQTYLDRLTVLLKSGLITILDDGGTAA
jgi:urease accessory protein